MALIKCPECGKEISDKADSCPSCGYPILATKEAASSNINNEQKDYTKIAAAAEKNKVESRITKRRYISGIISIVLGIISLCLGIFGNGGLLLILGGFFFIITGIGALNSQNKDKKRVQYLQNVSDGKKEILICPFCKGVNIEFDAVQSGVYTSGQTARISNNINPLQPFTHTNVRTSGTHSDISYKTLYICKDCGKTFINPDRMWNL